MILKGFMCLRKCLISLRLLNYNIFLRLIKLTIYSSLIIFVYKTINHFIETGIDSDKLNIFDTKISFEEAQASYNSYLINHNYFNSDYFLINTTNCKIPNFPAWSETAQSLLFKKCTRYFWDEPKCKEKEEYPTWTYLNRTNLHVNLTAVKDSGYSFNSIRCCYYVIIRVEQNSTHFDRQADRKVEYSKECFKVDLFKGNLIKEEFIRVFCMSTEQPFVGDIISRQFFAIPQLDKQARKKISSWDKKNVPNVVILGIDTMSRLNSHRMIPKTLEVLRNLGAVEMKGYTKVEDNTFGNTVAFLSGYSLNNFKRICDYPNIPQDECPYLFREFSQKGYVTVEIDDAPFGTGFNTGKVGFLRKPADFYPRPFMLNVMKHLKRDTSWYLRCLSGRQTEEVLLEYFLRVLEAIGNKQGPPVFAHLWFTVLAHDCSFAVKHSDQIFADFLEAFTKLYENSIVFFMGDHGENYGPFRGSEQGWYEDKLPLMWVYVPPKLRKSFPDWVPALKINSNRLTSHFDLYKTLVQILQTFGGNTAGVYPGNKFEQKGQSLFSPVPEDRSCEKTGIPAGYCACAQPKSIKISNPNVIKAAEVAFKYVREKIQSSPEGTECVQPEMGEIVQAKYLNSRNEMVYLVRFLTQPGNFLFEGTVKEKTKHFVIENDVLRVSKMERKGDCVRDSLLQKYCYCK